MLENKLYEIIYISLFFLYNIHNIKIYIFLKLINKLLF